VDPVLLLMRSQPLRFLGLGARVAFAQRKPFSYAVRITAFASSTGLDVKLGQIVAEDGVAWIEPRKQLRGLERLSRL
jgi:hypothetical protein